MTNTALCKWLRENSSGIYRPANEAATVIELLEAENKKIKDHIRVLCTSNCDGCDFFHYSQKAQCYECTHKECGKWLGENGGSGCKRHTELKNLGITE